MVVFYI